MIGSPLSAADFDGSSQYLSPVQRDVLHIDGGSSPTATPPGCASSSPMQYPGTPAAMEMLTAR
jgi:hypothetical protein